MDLYIIRHAWAGQSGDPKWPDDSKRPLTVKGKKRFETMAEILIERGMAPTVVATSPMVRCRQTAEILTASLIDRVDVIERNELLPEGDFESLWRWTAEQAETHQQIAWIGHSPQVNQYVAALIGLSQGSIGFAKGAAALIRFQNDLSPSAGELRWLITAKMLGI